MANLNPNLDEAIYTILNVTSLTDLAPGGVWNTFAPQDTDPPYVVFQPVSETDDYFAFSERGQMALYMVKGISRAPSPREAQTIATQIDSLLQNASLSITGFSLLECRRESAFFLPENLGGEVFQHRGGIYRVMADEP